MLKLVEAEKSIDISNADKVKEKIVDGKIKNKIAWTQKWHPFIDKARLFEKKNQKKKPCSAKMSQKA